MLYIDFFFFFQAEDGIRDVAVTGVQTCALPIFNDAGFPPPSFANIDPTKVTSAPFGWSPGYTMIPQSPCQIVTGGGGPCSTPTDFDIIIETEPNPNDPACTPNCSVQWIRYQLQGTTLMRGMVPKQ